MLPVALRVAGDAPASADLLAVASLAFEPAKTVCSPLRVTPSVAPLRRASNCSAAGEVAAGVAVRTEPVLGAAWRVALLDPDLTGAPVDLEGARETAGLFETAGLGALALGAGAGAGGAAFWAGASAQAPRFAAESGAGAGAAAAEAGAEVGAT
jgi:hypothetical protein